VRKRKREEAAERGIWEHDIEEYNESTSLETDNADSLVMDGDTLAGSVHE
jgi:hypothetical protein